MKRTYEEINAKIKSGDAVVMTAEEVIGLVESEGMEKATKEVDVVTTGTFGAMCSSGAFINFGHSEPPIKMGKVWLNDVPAYGGLAAVDAYIGATEPSSNGRARVWRGPCHRGPHRRPAGQAEGHLPRHRLLPAQGHRHLHLAQDGEPGLPVQPPERLPELRRRHQLLGEDAVHLHGQASAQPYGTCTYSSAGQLSPLLKDPNAAHHRHRHPHLPGRGPGLRRLGRHPVQDQRPAAERRAGRPRRARWRSSATCATCPRSSSGH